MQRFFRTSLILISFLLLSEEVYGQQAYAKTILDSLCHERYAGRGYVNDGDLKAADFIIRELTDIGVRPFKNKSFKQEYAFNVNTFPYPLSVILGKDTLTPGEDYLIHSESGTAQGDFTIKEINNQNLSEEYRGILNFSNLSQKQVLYAFNFTDVEEKKKRSELYRAAYTASNYFPTIWVEKNKMMYSVGRRANNYPFIIIDSAAYSSQQVASLKINNAYKPLRKTCNIIGQIPGKKKRKYIVFSAHFDHLGMMGTEAMFPGANDNASGVAMLLSIAKNYIKNKPEYTTVFCFFSGEEAGLEGSKHFVSHPYFKLRKVKFVLNIDIMGGAEKGITLVNGKLHENAAKTIETINQEKNYLDLIKRRGPTANSDHYFFSESGVPAFFVYSVGDVKNYHDIYDTAENTPLNKFNEVQALLLDFVSTL